MADYTLSAKIKGDASGFTKAFKSATDSLNELGEKAKVISKKIASFSMKASALTSALSSAVPLLATTGAGVGALGSAFVGAGVGVAGFGAVAVGVLGDVFTASEDLAKAQVALDNAGNAKERAAALEMQKEAMAGLSAEQVKAVQSLQTFKSFWGDFTKEFEKPVVSSFTKGLDFLQNLLVKIKPAISGTATAIDSMMSSLNKSLDNQDMVAFFDYIGKNAGTYVQNLGLVFGNTFRGIANLMTAFAPISNQVVLGMVNMTKSFADWASSLRSSDGFQTFMEYVKTNTPVVMSLIGNIGKTIGNLLVFLAPLGAVALIALNTLVGGLANAIKTITPIFHAIGSNFQGFVERIKVLAESMYDVVFGSMSVKDNGDLLTNMGFDPEIANRLMSITSKIGGIITSFWDIWFGSMSVKDNVDFMQGLGISESTATRVGNIATSIQNVVTASIGIIKSIISSMPGVFSSVFSTIGGIIGSLGTIFGTVWQVIQTFFSSVISGFNSAGGVGSGFAIQLGTVLLGLNPILKIIITLFQNFGPQIVAAFQQIATMVIPVVTTIGTAIGQLASAVIPIFMQALSTLIPIVMQVGMTFMSIISTVLPVLISLINQLVPIITQVVMIFAGIIAQVYPLAGILISSLLPVLTSLIATIMNIVQAVAPAFIAIINLIISVIQALLPIIMSILTIVINVFAGIISTVSPIVAFIGGIISAVMAVISPIIAFVAGVIASVINVIRPIIVTVTGIFNTVFSVVSGVFRNISTFIGTAINAIGTVISGLSSVVSGVFNTIFSIISGIMNNVSNTISGVFNAIQSAWTGLTGFVSGVFSGISGAVSDLVGQVKGFVNGVIGGINSAISIINKIPGVSIGSIPMLARGTDDWQGGFARINEGGRGELVNLPNGAQVIPHDVSMRYAREAGRNAGGDGVKSNNYNEQQIVIHLRPSPLVVEGRELSRISWEYDLEFQERNNIVKNKFKRR